MLPHDYLTFRLCGEQVTDRGDASGTGWFSPGRSAFVPEAFTVAGLDPEVWGLRLPRVLDATEVAGRITAEGAAALGVPAEVIVGPGTGDNMLVPYFDGERTPNLPDATGTFTGLTNATMREQLALAAHDGVLCGVLAGLDALREVGAA